MNRLNFAFSLIFAITFHICSQPEMGIAQKYAFDNGLRTDPAAVMFLDFEKPVFNGTGYGYTTDPGLVFAGNASLEIQHTAGTHDPGEVQMGMKDANVAYLRWYRRFEPGYQFVGQKMPGFYACASGAACPGSAGERPTGYDKFSCKLYVEDGGTVGFYTYHVNQSGGWGDNLPQNVGTPFTIQPGRWYCFEVMLKANNYPQADGEIKMWVDGVLKGHYKDMLFRKTTSFGINRWIHSAYVGGSWTSPKDQKLWDDNFMVATQYIGPMVEQADIRFVYPAAGEPNAALAALPAGPGLQIRYFVPRLSQVNLAVFTPTGKRVESLVRNRSQEGEQNVVWSSPAAPGTYLCRLEIGNKVVAKPFTLLK